MATAYIYGGRNAGCQKRIQQFLSAKVNCDFLSCDKYVLHNKWASSEQALILVYVWEMLSYPRGLWGAKRGIGKHDVLNFNTSLFVLSIRVLNVFITISASIRLIA